MFDPRLNNIGLINNIDSQYLRFLLLSIFYHLFHDLQAIQKTFVCLYSHLEFYNLRAAFFLQILAPVSLQKYCKGIIALQDLLVVTSALIQTFSSDELGHFNELVVLLWEGSFGQSTQIVENKSIVEQVLIFCPFRQGIWILLHVLGLHRVN